MVRNEDVFSMPSRCALPLHTTMKQHAVTAFWFESYLAAGGAGWDAADTTEESQSESSSSTYRQRVLRRFRT